MGKEIVLLDEENIKNKIHTIRGLKVMLDSDLAKLYNVKVGRLNEQVKRNIERFPKEFMFQLTFTEYDSLRSQFVTLDNKNLRSQFATSSVEDVASQNVIPKNVHGGRRYLPYVFTEQGVAMLSGVLNTENSTILLNGGLQVNHLLTCGIIV